MLGEELPADLEEALADLDTSVNGKQVEIEKDERTGDHKLVPVSPDCKLTEWKFAGPPVKLPMNKLCLCFFKETCTFGWLRVHDTTANYMAAGVEFRNVRLFEDESLKMKLSAVQEIKPGERSNLRVTITHRDGWRVEADTMYLPLEPAFLYFRPNPKSDAAGGWAKYLNDLEGFETFVRSHLLDPNSYEPDPAPGKPHKFFDVGKLYDLVLVRDGEFNVLLATKSKYQRIPVVLDDE